MPKKTAGVTPPAHDTAALLRKQFGDGCLVSGADLADEPEEFLSLSPQFDAHLGGGLRYGTVVTMSGPSGCGKTTTVLQACANQQRRGRRVFYANVEHKVFRRDVRGIAGLDLEAIHFIKSTPEKILTAEEFLVACEVVLRNERNALLVIDSFSSLSPSNEMNAAGYDGIPPGGANKLVGTWCRRMAPIIPVNNNLVIGIAQVYAAIGEKVKWATALPNKAKFARSTGLKCTHTEPILAGSGDAARQVGQVAHWIVERSACGPPGAKFASRIRYGEGLDRLGELVEIGTSLRLVEKSGNWLSYCEAKANGAENFRQALADDPATADALAAEIAGLIA